jgi:6-phosphogluconolactonase
MITKIESEDHVKLNQLAVDALVEKISNLLCLQEFVIIGIPGGRSVSGIFKLLEHEGRFDWSKVLIFMVDERLVSLDSPDSNYHMAKTTFIDNLISSGNLPERNVHPFRVNPETEEFSASDYSARLQKYGNSIDILILGVGEDGHVASLFPNHHSLQNPSDFYFTIDDSPKPPRERVTISKKLLQRANTIFLLFIGQSKEEAYDKFNNPDINEEDCPAKLAKNIENLYVVTDL